MYGILIDALNYRPFSSSAFRLFFFSDFGFFLNGSHRHWTSTTNVVSVIDDGKRSFLASSDLLSKIDSKGERIKSKHFTFAKIVDYFCLTATFRLFSHPKEERLRVQCRWHSIFLSIINLSLFGVSLISDFLFLRREQRRRRTRQNIKMSSSVFIKKVFIFIFSLRFFFSLQMRACEISTSVEKILCINVIECAKCLSHQPMLYHSIHFGFILAAAFSL